MMKRYAQYFTAMEPRDDGEWVLYSEALLKIMQLEREIVDLIQAYEDEKEQRNIDAFGDNLDRGL
jgi:hypothetical protein